MRLYPRRSLEGVALASKDRSAISGLRFDGNQTIATNGHVLITTTNKAQINNKEWTDFAPHKGEPFDVKWWDDMMDNPFTIPTETVKQSLKNLPRSKKELETLPISGCVAVGKIQMPEHLPHNHVTLQSFNGVQTVKEEESKFPNTEHVIPDYSNGDFARISVNPKLVKDIVTILAKDYDKITLHIHKTKNSEPVVITASDNEFDSEVILMPMRQDK